MIKNTSTITIDLINLVKTAQLIKYAYNFNPSSQLIQLQRCGLPASLPKQTSSQGKFTIPYLQLQYEHDKLTSKKEKKEI